MCSGDREMVLGEVKKLYESSRILYLSSRLPAWTDSIPGTDELTGASSAEWAQGPWGKPGELQNPSYFPKGKRGGFFPREVDSWQDFITTVK